MRTELFKKKTASFVETGSLVGDGIQLALQSGFEKIYSIELAEHYYDACVKKFANDSRVELIFGDSYFKLEELLKNNPETPFTYWLDGHFSGGDSGFGVKESPLIKELETILSRGVDGELIYIDDMRLYRAFDDETNIENIVKLLKKYKPHGTIHYESSIYDSEDILVVEY